VLTATYSIQRFRHPRQERDQRFGLIGQERAQHLRADRIARPPELPKLPLSRRGEGDRPRASVCGMRVAPDHSPLFQQDEHGPDGAGIRRHAAGELPLRQRMPAGERREEHKLVGRDAMRRELCF